MSDIRLHLYRELRHDQVMRKQKRSPDYWSIYPSENLSKTSPDVVVLDLGMLRCQLTRELGGDAVSKRMSDKLQFVVQSDKLKHVGHQTASLPRVAA